MRNLDLLWTATSGCGVALLVLWLSTVIRARGIAASAVLDRCSPRAQRREHHPTTARGDCPVANFQ